MSKQFGKGGVLALDDIDLVVERGEFVSLLGPSGCGKSTLLRLVADLDTPTSGRLTVNGKTPHQARLDRDYGMVFQQAGLFEWRTAVRNVQLPLRLMGFSPEQRKARAMETLELVQLTEFADHYPWQLSGGMQQRVSIARALAFRPQLLLMDEPLGALDDMTCEYLQTELIRLWSTTGLTVLFVTHSVTEAVFLSTQDRRDVAAPGAIGRADRGRPAAGAHGRHAAARRSTSARSPAPAPRCTGCTATRSERERASLRASEPSSNVFASRVHHLQMDDPHHAIP